MVRPLFFPFFFCLPFGSAGTAAGAAAASKNLNYKTALLKSDDILNFTD
jgi:hypothetical protein